MQFAQAGIDQQTRFVFRRYNIPTQEVPRNATAKLEVLAETGMSTGNADDFEQNAPKTSSLLPASSGG